MKSSRSEISAENKKESLRKYSTNEYEGLLDYLLNIMDYYSTEHVHYISKFAPRFTKFKNAFFLEMDNKSSFDVCLMC